MRTSTPPWGRLSRSLALRLGRPPGIVAGAHWLFRWLAVLTLLIALPAALGGAGQSHPWLALPSSMVLVWSWNTRLSRNGSPIWLDVIDAAAFTGFALALPMAFPVLGIVFGTIWLRSLHGTMRRALVRAAIFAFFIAVVLEPLWPLEHHGSQGSNLAGTVPVMFLTVVVARQLGQSLLAREQAGQRDGALASVGSLLLGQTDRERLLEAAWGGICAICAATPGLGVMSLVQDGPALRVQAATGELGSAPELLPMTVLTCTDAEPGEEDRRLLDAVSPRPWRWVCLPVPEVPVSSWLLLGGERQVSPDGVVAIRSLANQVALALRASTVHGRLVSQALTDGLTGLPNRAAFNAAISSTVEADVPGSALLFLDIDDFKHVNDTLGHQAGDALLVVVAARLLQVLRSQDVCARLGGDEFAILLDATSREGAADVGGRLVAALATPIRLGTDTVLIGASVGVASCEPGLGAEEVVRRADVAMYAAKAQGKSRVQVFDAGLLGGEPESVVTERRLGAALAADEFVVHYQPVLSLPDLTCVGFEALVRWQDPFRGLVLPGEFIEIAERTGAILDIGAAVLDQACADFRAWRGEHVGWALRLHVNVSVRQLLDEGFVELVAGCLARHGIPAGELVLELTESVLLDSPPAVRRLHDIAGIGVQLAVDDFGTGYSSLSALRSLPLSVVKIDRSFVEGAATNAGDAAIIEGIVQMARRLGLHTVAEGVERLDQQELLTRLGVGNVQGFLYLRPAPAVAFTTWLREHFATAARSLPRPRSGHADVVPLVPRTTPGLKRLGA